jgi:transposase
MDERIKFFVGLDAHKDSTSVAACEVGREPARFVGTIGPDVRGLIKLLAKAGDPAQISVVYEAGPTGYGLYRELCRRGYRCEIVAPSLIPRRTGDRIKNDRRDCLRLAELSRAGELKPIWVPDQPVASARGCGEHAAQGTPADEGVPVAPGTPLSRQDVMDQEP